MTSMGLIGNWALGQTLEASGRASSSATASSHALCNSATRTRGLNPALPPRPCPCRGPCPRPRLGSLKTLNPAPCIPPQVAMVYMENWLRGTGCVPIHNLMEDAATAEISRWVGGRGRGQGGQPDWGGISCVCVYFLRSRGSKKLFSNTVSNDMN